MLETAPSCLIHLDIASVDIGITKDSVILDTCGTNDSALTDDSPSATQYIGADLDDTPDLDNSTTDGLRIESRRVDRPR